jgi:2-polyprenyl-3-methyl-5-hydroxy-6-metoxy-1,4-benzoquinol methylase
MDYSQEGLLLARKHFDFLGLSASFLYADALNIEPNLQEKFDVAMSFGTVEHYRYPERLLIAKAHIDLVKPQGVVIISVPNRWFLPHEILKFYLQRRGKWREDYERAFSQQELLKLGNKLGLENIKIYGSSFIIDMSRYLRIYQETALFRKFCRVPPRGISTHDLVSPFDNLLGADIFLMGRKPSAI